MNGYHKNVRGDELWRVMDGDRNVSKSESEDVVGSSQ